MSGGPARAPSARSGGRPSCPAKVLLDRRHASLLGLEQALEVLARVHEPLRADHAGCVKQDGVRELRDLIADAESRRQNVGERLETLLADEGLVLLTQTVTREDDL